MISKLLTLSIVFLSLCSFGQNAYYYTVESIPFQEFQEEDIIQFNADDIHSEIINIPFAFNFFDVQNITEFVVGSNGTMTFDLSEAGTGQQWNFGPEDLIPSAILPFPSILGSFHDMDNRFNDDGGIYTGMTGEAPTRKFYVVFEDIAHFQCNEITSSFQIVIHESTGIIDINIKDKPVCDTWNNGLTAIGLQAEVNDDLIGIAAPGRNTGAWVVQNEAWRFTPVTTFDVVACDENNDASEDFDMDNYINSLYQLFNLDVESNTITITDSNDAEVSGIVTILLGDDLPENAYDISINGQSQTFDLNLSLLDCSVDNDTDGLTNEEEDVNGNGNLADDDTDGDGIPNYLDDDDDNDNVLTNIEVVFTDRNANGTSNATFLDTDDDGIPNHLDYDDDGDGVLSIDEDYNGNGDPTDDDINDNGIADYLDNDALSIDDISTNSLLLSIYPNPVQSELNVEFASQLNYSGKEFQVELFDYQGRLISRLNQSVNNNQLNLDVASLASGNYLLVVSHKNFRKAKKFIKE